MSKFSHLHVHTQYSLLDGAASIDALYKKAMNDGMPALAITDHGNMFGVFEFVSQAYKYKNPDGSLMVKPIVGCEFYITKDRHRKTFSKDDRDPRCHQVLLAKNEIGYKNLSKLCSLGFLEGLYSKYPRIDKELILKYHEGLIATTCCLGAMVPQAILRKSVEEAELEFKWWLDIFGEDYYVELQRHNMAEQDRVNEVLIGFARKYGVKIIASNDSHYVNQSDFNAHDILLCINTGEKITTPAMREFSDDDVSMKNKRFAFPNDQFFFKTSSEMAAVFKDLPEAIDNTNEIVGKIETLRLEKDILLPNFPIPDQFRIHSQSIKTSKKEIEADVRNQWEYLKHLTFEGAYNRYGTLTADVEERLNFELQTIHDMGFAGYFLIVADFIKAGRDMGVFVGPGRGSAAGSAVAYCIGITNIDPIKYDLLFERFLNPDRVSMPDIDTDFDDVGRQRVIDYVVKQYGQNQVAQIVTFGTMAAKMSIKDVARVMDLPLSESNMLAKLVPEKPGISLNRVIKAPLTDKEGEKSLESKEGLGADELEGVKKLREIHAYTGTDPMLEMQAKVLKEALVLEGSVRNTGIHAAGIIIAPKDLTDLIPVCTAKDSDLYVTQIEGSVIESAGVIKMDFLGLKTLTIIKNALEMIKANHGVEIVPDDMPLNDDKTFELYQRGDTIGTFQFESPGMQKYLRDLKPDQFGDLIAMNALYRPGPLEYIPNFIDRKHGREVIAYDLPEMEIYLKETYGITVYQEQVMLLSQLLGGFSKGDADVLRKAMGKKDRKTLDKLKPKFIEGASTKGHPTEKLEKIWTDWEAFAAYAFNKSHSTCYAFVAYQTAYLKAHYPAEYMAAVLNNAGSMEKITFFMEECKRMGIKVLGPDVNESAFGFAVNKKGQIRFGLGSLKGMSENAVDALVNERAKSGTFATVFDVVRRTNLRAVNKRALETMAKSGAFDSFTQFTRAQYFHLQPNESISGIEKIYKYGQSYQTNTLQQSNSLFGESQMPEIPEPKIAICEPWNLVEQLEFEKEVTGMFLSGHPLDHFRFEMNHFGITPIKDFVECKDNLKSNRSQANRPFRLAGLVVDVNHRLTKTGKQFGNFVIEDYSGKTEFALFGEEYIRFNTHFQLGAVVFVTGGFKNRWGKEDEFEFKVNNVMLLETVKKTLCQKLALEMDPKVLSPEFIQFLIKNIKQYPGNTRLELLFNDVKLQAKAGLYSIKNGFEVNEDLISFVEQYPDIRLQVTAV